MHEGTLAIAVFAAGAVGCAIPRRPAELPPSTEGYVAVLSGEMPASLSQVARHSWIVANVPGESGLRRWEMAGSGQEPFRYFGDGDVALHAVLRYGPAELRRVVDCLDGSRRRYDHEHPDYFPIPGPNSNTMVDFMLRRCGVHVELPATAIGRDYRGPVGASVTSLGTGVQVESWLVGLEVGLEEGIELHVLDMSIGVHFWPPGITVPVNPGRVDLEAGAGAPLSFAYAARLYPVGAALMLDRNTFVGAYAGIGSDGMPGGVPAALAIPAEVRLEVDVARSVRTGLRADAEWFPPAPERRGGDLLPLVDSLGFSGFVRIGEPSRCGCYGYLGRGYFFALERREVMRSAWIGLTFGVEADMGG